MPEPGKRAKILIVDDDSKQLAVSKRHLEAAGYSVVALDTALKLPQTVQREQPDLILLDVEMPALRGEHVLELSAIFDFLKKIPIVLYSAKSEDELQSIVEKSHARGFIRKTNNAITFVSSVERFLTQ